MKFIEFIKSLFKKESKENTATSNPGKPYWKDDEDDFRYPGGYQDKTRY